MTSEPPVVGEPPEPEQEQKSLVRRFGPAVVGIAAILLVFLVLLPRIANYSDVWDVVTGLSNEALVALALATAINVATYGPPWMAALPGLNYRQSMVLTQTSTAISIAVPGGDAVGIAASYAMLRSWRFRSQRGRRGRRRDRRLEPDRERDAADVALALLLLRAAPARCC